jgi:hypothetical protein
MSDIIQWAIVGIALLISTIYMVRKLRRTATSKCDGCCEGCKLHANPETCDDPKRHQN